MIPFSFNLQVKNAVRTIKINCVEIAIQDAVYQGKTKQLWGDWGGGGSVSVTDCSTSCMLLHLANEYCTFLFFHSDAEMRECLLY